MRQSHDEQWAREVGARGVVAALWYVLGVVLLLGALAWLDGCAPECAPVPVDAGAPEGDAAACVECTEQCTGGVCVIDYRSGCRRSCS